jgi:drug/metabolite transporter (DMT)-like permease
MRQPLFAKPLRLPPWAGAAMVGLAAVCFSAKAIMIKLAFAYHVDPLSLLFLRMTFSLPFFVVIPLLQKARPDAPALRSTDYLKLAGLGVLGYYASSLLDFLGLQYVTAGLERLILFVYPTLVVLLSWLIWRKPIGRREIVALLLTYAGIAVVFSHDAVRLQPNVLLGALLIFGSAFTYAVYLIGSGRLIPRFGAVAFTAYAMTVSALSVILHYLIASPTSVFQFPPEVFWFGLALAIVSTVIPTFLVSAGIKAIGASRAAIVASIGPVVTIALGYFFLREPVTLYEIAGTALVLAGVLMVSVKKEREAVKA